MFHVKHFSKIITKSFQKIAAVTEFINFFSKMLVGFLKNSRYNIFRIIFLKSPQTFYFLFGCNLMKRHTDEKSKGFDKKNL